MSDAQTIGRYRVVQRIGRGGMGVLYKAVDEALDREVAIKVMSDTFEAESDAAARARFYREARAAAKLQHRNIITVFEFAEEDGAPYMVMEFLRGQTLADRMRSGTPLTLEQKLDVVSELCAGLQYAHERGVVHRDVKPGNIWLLDDGTVKLLDFGIARTSSSTLTRQGDIIGSAQYMSPEQVAGKSVDGRSDVFSCGVVLYELLAGRTPFLAESPTATILRIATEDPVPIASIVDELPPGLSDALAQALEKDVDRRYQSAGDFGTDLQLVRMSLYGTADTMFAGSLPLTARLPQGPAVDLPLAAVTQPPEDNVVPAPHVGRSKRSVALWVATAVAAVALGSGLGVIAARRSRGGVVTTPSSVPPPPGGEAAPPPRQVMIASSPAGASIELDGKPTTYVTPARIPVSPVPPRRVHLTLKGFDPIDAELTADSVSEGSVTYHLVASAPPSVKLTATGSYPFEIVDGRRVLSPLATSHQLSVAAPQRLRLRAEAQLLDYAFSVDGTAGQALQIHPPSLGGLTIRSAMETCQVLANGHNLGFPPVNNQAVAAGTYQLQLSCPDGQKVPGTAVTVVAGETRIARIP